MRFIERTIRGIGYHRWHHLVLATITIGFVLVGLFLLTSQNFNSLANLQFNQRLSDLNLSNEQAIVITNRVAAAHALLDANYQLWFLAAAGIFFLFNLGLAISAAYRRAAESRSYLLLGKSPTKVALQYATESMFTFTAVFIGVSLVLLIISGGITAWWNQLNQGLFQNSAGGRALLRQFNTQFSRIFDHQLTGFSDQSLLFAAAPVSDSLLVYPKPFLLVFLTGIGLILLSHLLAAGFIRAFAKRDSLAH
ncbi:hypothetical protein [Lacticaseibacillus brantae]|uniref:hypothetical protein n=1 Tax=Lacticaseibacillus brantae TaxID=943673 RepID=UPI00070BDC5D|nr:hypothetical protein [Lacticaseibacillus brantae]